MHCHPSLLKSGPNGAAVSLLYAGFSNDTVNDSVIEAMRRRSQGKETISSGTVLASFPSLTKAHVHVALWWRTAIASIAKAQTHRMGVWCVQSQDSTGQSMVVISKEWQEPAQVQTRIYLTRLGHFSIPQFILTHCLVGQLRAHVWEYVESGGARPVLGQN